MPEGVLLPAGTELRSLLGTEDQTNCEFRTAHPVQLLPIQLVGGRVYRLAAAVAALGLPDRRGVKAAIRLRLKITGEMGFTKLALDRLDVLPRRCRGRAHAPLRAARLQRRPDPRPSHRPPAALAGEPAADRAQAARVRTEGGAAAPRPAVLRRLPAAAGILRHAGAVPVRGDRAGSTAPPSAAPPANSTIVILLDRADPTLAAGFNADAMLLFCTPAINLFPRRGDRINLGERQAEHQVVPDRMRPLDFEVFDVAASRATPATAVPRSRSCRSTPPTTSAGTPSTAATTRCAASRGNSRRAPASAARAPAISATRCSSRWSMPSRRRPTATCASSGIDLLCTNRDLPLSMPVGRQQTDFTILVSAPVASVRCAAWARCRPRPRAAATATTPGASSRTSR